LLSKKGIYKLSNTLKQKELPVGRGKKSIAQNVGLVGHSTFSVVDPVGGNEEPQTFKRTELVSARALELHLIREKRHKRNQESTRNKQQNKKEDRTKN
jgi:predicted DNA-binding WGR domain protein